MSSSNFEGSKYSYIWLEASALGNINSSKKCIIIMMFDNPSSVETLSLNLNRVNQSLNIVLAPIVKFWNSDCFWLFVFLPNGSYWISH